MTEPTKHVAGSHVTYGGSRVHYTPGLDGHRANRTKPVDIMARHIADYFDDVHGEVTTTPHETERALATFLHELGYRQVNP